MDSLDDFAMKGLKSLQRAVDQALERKRRLGQYAVFWENGRVVFEGPDAPEEPDSREPQSGPDRSDHRDRGRLNPGSESGSSDGS